MNGRQHFERLVQDLKAGRRPPAAVRQWLADGAKRWECEPDTSLEVALGLIRSRDALHFRNVAIAEAVKAMPAQWPTSERVRQVRRAERALTPYLSDPELASVRNRPAWFPPVLEAIRYAPLPGGDRQLRELCSLPGNCKKPARQYRQRQERKTEDQAWT